VNTIDEAIAHLRRCLPDGCSVNIQPSHRYVLTDGAVQKHRDHGETMVSILHGTGDEMFCECGFAKSLSDATAKALNQFYAMLEFRKFKRDQQAAMDKVLNTCIES
jgi:hypothetical protein